METSERLMHFKPIHFSSIFDDTLRILEQNDLCVLEANFDRGLIRARVLPSNSREDIQVIAKFWRGKKSTLVGLRGSLSYSLSGGEKLNKKLKRLETDLRRLDYAC